MLGNLSSHFHLYSTNVAIWQQGLENFKNNLFTMLLGFQKLLSILRLIVDECLIVYLQNKIIVPIISRFVSGTIRNLKKFSKKWLDHSD